MYVVEQEAQYVYLFPCEMGNAASVDQHVSNDGE